MKPLLISMFFLCVLPFSRGEEGLRELPDQSIYAKDGLFLKVALLDDPQGFISAWQRGGKRPGLHTRTVFHRGEIVFPAVMYSTNARDSEGNAHIEYTLLFRRPDGSIYEHLQNLTAVKGTPSKEVALSQERAGLKIEEKDPFGEYTLKVTLADKVRDVTVEMLFTFSVVDPDAKPVESPTPGEGPDPGILQRPTPQPTTRMRPFSGGMR
ncbi:MAG: hypothetical protein IAE94_04865 [Chthoniobacterales bacterium]|nr:hypothetical protein [Chthoniobacterales bacterium]